MDININIKEVDSSPGLGEEMTEESAKSLLRSSTITQI